MLTYIIKHRKLLILLMLAAAYFTWYKSHLIAWTLPQTQEEKPLQITGDIISIPTKNHEQMRFDFLIYNPNRIVRLNWPKVPAKLHVGERWQLLVKLKRIHGVHNPGSFDYESWALLHGLRASGSVINTTQNKLIAQHWYVHPIDQLRQIILQKLQQHLPTSQTAHWLIALIIGERAAIPQEQWQVLRHTGTNHLMAIGGLHIGMVAGAVFFIINRCWRRASKLMLKLPAQEASACAALLIAWLYGALSGFAIPAQRACLMLTVYTLATLSRRKLNAWHVWLLAMTVVLIINPLSVWDNSFWLSFGTIALIIFGMNGTISPHNLWWKHGRVQWVIGFGLLPLSLLFFQECSLTSFIANSIAIPWLGIFILPFCLVGTVFIFLLPPLGHFLLLIADKSLELLWGVLQYLAHFQFATWSQAMPNAFIFMLSLCGILLLVTPAKFPARWFGILWLMPLLLFKPQLLRAGEAKLTLLDVGQGLSAVVQTRHHVLVFDSGPPSPSVVVPFLRTQFVKKIDMMVISHGDLDHIGGAEEILNDIPVKQITTSVPEKFPNNKATLCLAGQHWQWDGVEFSFIYPYLDTLHLGNDSSCVLRVEAGQYSALIPGDIEQFAEIKMLERTPNKLNATTLIAPHHGSHTSGLPAFIQAVYPRYVLFATGYRNRYHFPHQDIIESYKTIHSEAFDTAKQGAVEWIMGGFHIKSKTYINNKIA